MMATSTAQPTTTPTSPASNAYTFNRASTMSTRAMLDAATSPADPTTTTSALDDTADADEDTWDPQTHHPRLHRRRTNNYETAVNERKASLSSTSPTSPTSPSAATGTLGGMSGNAAKPDVSASHVYRGEGQEPGSAKDRPGMLGRVQSWRQEDQRRGFMERMLSSGKEGGMGYSSTE